MENIRSIQHVNVYLFFSYLCICARLSGKGESTLAIFLYIHKGQRGKIFLVQNQAGGVHLFFFQYLAQEFSMCVLSGLSKKRCMSSQLSGSHSHIGRSAAWISGIQHLSILIYSLGSKINQNLAERCNVIDRTADRVIRIRQNTRVQKPK